MMKMQLGSIDNEDFWAYDDKPDATRNLSGQIINRIKKLFTKFHWWIRRPCTFYKTLMKDAGDFSKDNYAGRNLHFGVRELAMAGIGNGIALHGGLRPYVSTFFVFSDYVKPMARLTSLMGLQ